ncbi:MAG: hypothetical protein ABEJ27_00665 [Halodesulfurarchaeum sp.]
MPGRPRFVALLPLALAAVALLPLAGCLGMATNDGTMRGETPGVGTPTDTPSPTDASPTRTLEWTFPRPPDTLTNESALRTARRYEAALLAARLDANRTVRSFRLGCCEAARPDGAVRGPGGAFYVIVRMPYRVRTGAGSATAVARGAYRITDSRIRRISVQALSRSGSERTDGPGPGSNDTDARIPLRVLNFGSDPVSLTVVATELAGEPRTALARRLTVPGRADALLARGLDPLGRFRITLSTRDRTISRPLRLDGYRPRSSVAAVIAPDGRLSILLVPGHRPRRNLRHTP